MLVAIFGLVMLIRARKKGGRAWSITALVIGVFALFLAAQSALTPEAALPTFAAADVSEALGVSESAARAAIEEAFRVGAYNATSGIGAYLALAGSALAVVSAIFGIVWAKGFRRTVAANPSRVGEIPPMPPPPPQPVP